MAELAPKIPAMADANPHHQLERLGRELKCPICLSLFKQAVSLSCNHCFCTACIQTSLKRISSCPICKVPTTRREVRPAPHMDNLVTICRGMETATGISIFATQQTQEVLLSGDDGSTKAKKNPKQNQRKRKQVKNATGCNALPSTKRSKFRRTDPLTEVTNEKLVTPNKKKDVGLNADQSLKRIVPTKKRVHVPKSGTIGNDSATKCSKPSKQKIPTTEPEKEGRPNASNHLNGNEDGRSWEIRRCGDIQQAGTCSEQVLELGGSSMAQFKLTPFFWLKDDDTQEGTQTRSLETLPTNPQQLPSFSDIKCSDDEQSPGEEADKVDQHAAADSFDSDVFAWTQRPCSPEVTSTPQKNLKGNGPVKEVVAPVDNLDIDGTLVTLSEQDDYAATLEQKTVQNPFSSSKASGKRCVRKKIEKESLLKVLKPRRRQQKQCSGLKKSKKMCKPEGSGLKKTKKMCKPEVIKQVPNGKCIEGLGKTVLNGVDRAVIVSRVSNGIVEDNGAGLEETSEEAAQVRCAFCQLPGNSKIAGAMMAYKDGILVPVQGSNAANVLAVHRICAEWAPDVYFPNEDGEVQNLEAEVGRGQKMKCSKCGKKGAALGCCITRCRKTYHYPCAKAIPACRWDMEDFVVLCPDHAACEFPKRKKRRVKTEKASRIPRTPKLSCTNIEYEKAVEPSCSPQYKKWHSGPSSKWIICGSALDSTGKELLTRFASVTGATLRKAWSRDVTHIIARTDQNGSARRTFKFLMAILEGKWILKTDWIHACLTNGCYVHEEQFEVSNDIHGVVGGPKKGRALAASKGPKLFDGFSFYFVGSFEGCKADLQALVGAGGGAVLHRKPISTEEKCSKCLVVYSEDGKKSAEVEAKAIAHAAGATFVPHSWLLDSLAACTLQHMPS